MRGGRDDQTKAKRRARQQHVKRNTTKYENDRRSQQAAETAPIKQQGESHIRTKIVEHGLGGGGIPVQSEHTRYMRTEKTDGSSDKGETSRETKKTRSRSTWRYA